MNDTISEILTGSFDLHVHAGPDIQERRLDALQTARHAYEAEMAGFVLKSHEYPTEPLAGALRQMYPGLDVAGAIALNRSVGGVNPDAVEVSARLGAKVVWMPTFDADAWRRGQGRGPGLRIADDAGALTPATRAVLEIVRARDMALASGHVAPREALALFRAAREAGITRMIATHPAAVASIEQQREMADLGAYVEYTFLSCMPSRAQMTVEELVAALQRIGDGSMRTDHRLRPVDEPARARGDADGDRRAVGRRDGPRRCIDAGQGQPVASGPHWPFE